MIANNFFLTLFFSLYGRQICGQLNQKLLVISFDGFKEMYMDNGRFLPWFRQFQSQGVYSDKVESIFPSETFPNHYAIATGMYAESHGIVSNYFYDPNLNESFAKVDNSLHWWDQAEPLWISAQRQGKKTAISFWPGSSVVFPDDLKPEYCEPYDSSVPFEDRIEATINHLAYDDVDLAMIYYDKPDSIGHTYGVLSDEVDAALESADWYLSYVLKLLDQVDLGKDKLNVIICADHGMVNRTQVVNLSDYIDIDANIDMVPNYGVNMMIQPKPGLEDAVIAALSVEGAPFNVYRRSEIPEYYHYSNNQRILDVFVECHEGAYISIRGEDPYSFGLHGYNPALSDMKPIFFARGPAFLSGGVKAKGTFKTKDIYAIMAYVTGITPSQSNASLEDVWEIFNAASTASLTGYFLVLSLLLALD